jgi:hypothetical protein
LFAIVSVKLPTSHLGAIRGHDGWKKGQKNWNKSTKSLARGSGSPLVVSATLTRLAAFIGVT